MAVRQRRMMFMEFSRQIRRADSRRRKYLRDVAARRSCNAGYTTMSQRLLRRRRLLEDRHALDAVLERLGAVGRQDLHVVQRGVDVVLPDFLGQVVDELDAVAIGIV